MPTLATLLFAATLALSISLAPFRATAAPRFELGQTVTTTAEGASSVYAIWDLDGDDWVDLVVGSAGDDTISWFKNEAFGVYGDARVVTTSAVDVRSVYVAWVDEDNAVDIIAADAGGFAWYKNQIAEEGTPDWSERKVISDTALGAQDVVLGDITGDGFYFEVVGASKDDDTVFAYEFDPDTSAFDGGILVSDETDGPAAVNLSDIDDDGWLDVIVGSQDDDRVVWYRYRHREGIFSQTRLIDDSIADPTSVFSVDIDDDGFRDVLVASSGENTIAWYRNRVKEPTDDFAPPVIIDDDAIGASSVYAFDMDGDGDWDVLSTSAGDDKVSLYRNLDGAGTFGPRQVITDTALGAQEVTVSDLDGDFIPDVIFASAEDDTVAWYRGLPEPSAGLAAYASLCAIARLRRRR
jgi:hypothetical protein